MQTKPRDEIQKNSKRVSTKLKRQNTPNLDHLKKSHDLDQNPKTNGTSGFKQVKTSQSTKMTHDDSIKNKKKKIIDLIQK